MHTPTVRWHTDQGGRTWLVLDGELTPYFRLSGVDEEGYYWALYDDRDRAWPWPALGRYVVRFPTPHDLDRWIQTGELP
jgi:hypothetical protein